MEILVKVHIILVERVVGQMHKVVLIAFCLVILFTSQSHQPVFVKKKLHGTYGRGDEHIYSEIILVTLIQSWLLHILLNYILHLVLAYAPTL